MCKCRRVCALEDWMARTRRRLWDVLCHFVNVVHCCLRLISFHVFIEQNNRLLSRGITNAGIQIQLRRNANGSL